MGENFAMAKAAQCERSIGGAGWGDAGSPAQLRTWGKSSVLTTDGYMKEIQHHAIRRRYMYVLCHLHLRPEQP